MDPAVNNVFAASPATVVVHLADRDQVWIAAQVLHIDGDGQIPLNVVIRANADEKWFPCVSIHDRHRAVWRATLWSDGDRGGTLTIRPTVEADAIRAITMPGLWGAPLPVEVLADIHRLDPVPGSFTMPRLYALSGDGGVVDTIMLTAGPGIYLRRGWAWVPLIDEDEIDGATVHEVPGAAVPVFDERRGRIVVEDFLLHTREAAATAGPSAG